MSITEDLQAARGLGNSRKHIAELSGLTEGKVWRIERKGNPTTDELAALQPVLTQLLANRSAGRLPTASPTSRAAATPAQTPARPSASTVGTEQRRPIDWARLMGLAAQVSDHEVERALKGPDPTTARLFSNSELQTFKDCRRKWWLAWYRSLTLKTEKPVGALAIGDRVHRALACWYVPEGYVRVDPRDALEVLITQDWTRVVQAYGEERALELAELEKQFASEANLERAMISGYMEWLAETGADADLKIIGGEEYLEATLPDLRDNDDRPVKIIGKIDVRAYRTTDGKRKFIDHKTVADLVKPRQTVGPNEQMLHYELLEFLNTPEGEAHCDGALYNMLRKVRRTVQAKPPFFDRVEVTHNSHYLESYKSRVIEEIQDILNLERRLRAGEDPVSVAYPRPNNDCTWKCEFLPVCNMFDDGSRAEDMLKSYYRQHDPLAYYAQTEE